ncbi:iron-containing alcohol dehydrogenase, partial [Faucicola atlantae]|uniref:iron-containing alcohol dehydrogenase n=1 Tax=Faucicola atlantae TaxID=34059 RepID=UPI0012E7D0B5
MSVIKSITSPMKFLIQANLLSQLGEYLKPYGKAGLLVCDPFILQKAQQDTEATFKEHNIQAVFSKFSGETTDDEINRLRAIMDDNNAEFVVGLGGGKTLDTAKAVAYYQKVPVIIIRCRK